MGMAAIESSKDKIEDGKKMVEDVIGSTQQDGKEEAKKMGEAALETAKDRKVVDDIEAPKKVPADRNDEADKVDEASNEDWTLKTFDL